jgi:hypothetical protein
MTSDPIGRLEASNPVPRHATVRVGAAPVFSARPRGRSRRLALLVLAIVLAVLVGGPALALRLGVIDFGSAEHAPPHVVRDFSTLSKGAPPGMDPGVVAKDARQVRIGDHILWIAPTRFGGLCYGWGRGSGGCDKLGTVPLSVSWLGRSLPSEHDFYAVEGYAHARWVDAVEVELDDGTRVRPDVTWISKPIDAGFFRYAAPPSRDVVSVVGLHDGEAVTGEDASMRPGPHPYARLDERRQIASLSTANGPARLWSAPTKTDGRCVWLESQGRERGVVPCLPAGYERQIALGVGVYVLGGVDVLAGECGYRAVELVHPDGSVRTVECGDGVVFARLEEADMAGVLRAVGADGRPLPTSEAAVQELVTTF